MTNQNERIVDFCMIISISLLLGYTLDIIIIIIIIIISPELAKAKNDDKN